MSEDENNFSRRRFLRTGTIATAAAGIDPTSTPQAIPSQFAPATTPRKISDHLFVLEDTCNVYLVRSGSSGLLVDFGSGAMLKHLPALGVSSIDWVLHTHHHRDQAQGDDLAVAEKIPIAVPVHERQYFQDVENFWRNRRIFDMHYVRNDFFSLTRDIPVTAVLEDYATFRWKEYNFFIQPTPGHTPGSITLVTTIDAVKVAFAGDLMQEPGKVRTLFDLQYYYDEHEGADLSAYSLKELINQDVALLCPSHGAEMRHPVPGMQDLVQKLTNWYEYWKSWGGSVRNKARQLTPHVVAHYQTMCSFYAVISDSGKGMLIDYGFPSWNAFYTYRDATDTYDRMRFLEHSIDEMRANHGLKSVDVAIASHMHDDHVSGFPYLTRRYGTKIWIFENFAEILANPCGRNLGCTLGEAIPIHRVIRDRETFRWEEFEFTAIHCPGHTNYQMALFSTIDGVRIGFTGDAFFHDAGKAFEIRHNLIYRNRVNVGDHLKSVGNLIEFKPQIIAPGHGEPFLLDMDMVKDLTTKLEKQDEFCRSLIADPDTDVGMDPSPLEIVPYQSLATPGDKKSFELRARNHRSWAVQMEIALALPPGWTCHPTIAKLTIEPHDEGRTTVQIKIPEQFQAAHQRVAIAADVLADGKYLGQIGEAVIDIRASAPSPQVATATGF